MPNIIALTTERGDYLYKQRIDIIPPPTRVPYLDPVIVDGRAAATVVEAIGHAAAAEAPTAVVAKDAAVEVFLRGGVEGPVDGGPAEKLVAAGRLVGRDDLGVRPRFEDEDPLFAGLGEAVCED